MLLFGCGRTGNPELARDRIQQEIRHGDLVAANSDVDQALERYARAGPQWEWQFRILKATVLISQSDGIGALAALNGTLPASLAGTDLPIQKSLYEGMAYRIAEDFGSSRRALSQAQDLAGATHPRLLSRILTATGDLDAASGDYRAARTSYTSALPLARQQHDQDTEAALLLDLARLDTLEHRFDEAIGQNDAALELSRSIGRQSYVATIFGNLGWSYGELGDFETSLNFYKQAAEASAKSGMTGYSAYWFSGVATASTALREYATGEALARTTLQQAKALKNVQTRIACLQALAEITLRTNRLNEAQQYIQEALALETNGKNGPGFPDTQTLAGEIAVAQGRFPEAEALFQGVLSEAIAPPQPQWEAEAGLARVRDGQGKSVEAEQHLLAAINIMEKARQSINHDELRLSFLSSGIRVYGQYIDFLLRQRRSSDALMEAELSRARTLQEGLRTGMKAENVALANFHPELLARRLKATLLLYWLGDPQSHLWIITPTKTTHLALPSADQIVPLVKSYREALLRLRDPLATGNPDAPQLYRMLVQPAQQLIPKDLPIVLLPDTNLYDLNFETLVVPEPKPHYWIEDVTLTTASSLTLLASAARQSAPKDGSLLLIGDTVPPNAEFPALPQAAEEMKDLEKYFSEAHRKVLSGSEATPDAYLSSHPEQFAYLHLVTHGTASRARPLESAVVLSKEKDTDAFKLYAREILKHHLSAYLVTISACNGAGLRAYSGEGLVGLSWAFLRAGAHNVIGALWEVSDSSTPQLMDKLYSELSQGKDPASALRDAKLSLLHSDSVYRKPFYWAPFQLYAGS